MNSTKEVEARDSLSKIGICIIICIVSVIVYIGVRSPVRYEQSIAYDEHPCNCQKRLHTVAFIEAEAEFDDRTYLYSTWCCVEDMTDEDLSILAKEELKKAKQHVKENKHGISRE